MSRRETGVQRDVAERVLGHTIRGVEGIYGIDALPLRWTGSTG